MSPCTVPKICGSSDLTAGGDVRKHQHSHIFTPISVCRVAESTNFSVTTDDPEPAPNIHGSGDYPLAVKMMFNYNVESQADRILSAMAKETVPAQSSLTESVARVIR